MSPHFFLKNTVTPSRDEAKSIKGVAKIDKR